MRAPIADGRDTLSLQPQVIGLERATHDQRELACPPDALIRAAVISEELHAAAALILRVVARQSARSRNVSHVESWPEPMPTPRLARAMSD